MPNNFESTPLHDKSCNILFDKLKFGLAYIILQNKPIENSIEEDYKDHKIKEVTTINSHDVKLRKRILELENDCENLKQKLCLMELAIEEISEIVDKETSDRYLYLVEKQKLETDQLITYCPQKLCQAPVRKLYDKLCVCPRLSDYMKADGESKFNFELRYGKKNLEKLVRDAKQNWKHQNG
ncbi:7519_t:CDS:2 [Entrophospora sp. SA101]|nr:7519_t:CDS:2 [Entrophospora sp. SA101]